MVAPVSRRELLAAAGLAGGSALVAAGCGSTTSRPAKATAVAPAQLPDVVILNTLLDLEHLLEAAYVAAIPLLSHHNRRAATHFLQQELDHITRLQGIVQQFHGKPDSAKPSYDLGRPRGEAEVMGLLHRVENQAIRAYLDAIPRLAEGEARQTAGSILAVEAQHVSIIRRDLGLSPVPAPLVAGAE